MTPADGANRRAAFQPPPFGLTRAHAVAHTAFARIRRPFAKRWGDQLTVEPMSVGFRSWPPGRNRRPGSSGTGRLY